MKLLSNFRAGDWIATALAAVLAGVLAYWGFLRCADCGPKTPAEIISATIALLRFSGRGYSLASQPWQLVVAQYLVPVVAAWAAFKLIVANLRRDVRVMLVRRYRDHVIVCGIGSTGGQVAENLALAGFKVAAVDLVADGPEVTTCETLRLPVLKGDAGQGHLLELAGLSRAKALVLCCGEDSMNLDIGLKAAAMLGAKPRRSGEPTVILPEMRHTWLLRAIATNTTHALGSAAAEIRPFNIHEISARILLRRPSFARSSYLVGDRSPLLVILGLNGLGLQVIRHAVRMLSRVNIRPRFIVVDSHATDALANFLRREPAIESVAGFTAIDASLEPDRLQPFDEIASKSGGMDYFAVIGCLPDDESSLHSALEFRQWLDGAGHFAIPVYHRLAARGAVGPLSMDLDPFAGAGDRLCAFGARSDVMSSQVLIGDSLDRLARYCHEQYRSSGAVRSMGADVEWNQLAEAYKEANRLEADHIELKLRLAGLRSLPAASPNALSLTDGEVDRLAQIEHHRWLVERKLAGWSHGGDRDEARRRHPLLCDWMSLPDSARTRTRSQVGGLPALLARTGREIRREQLLRLTAGSLERVRATCAQPPSPDVYRILVVDAFDPDCSAAAEELSSDGAAGIWLAESADDRPFHSSPDEMPWRARRGLSAKAEGWWPRSGIPSGDVNDSTRRTVG